MSAPVEGRGVRFMQENALALARLAVAGFSLRYLLDELEADAQSAPSRDFFAAMRAMVGGVSPERALLVLDGLQGLVTDNEAERQQLQALLSDMRRAW